MTISSRSFSGPVPWNVVELQFQFFFWKRNTWASQVPEVAPEQVSGWHISFGSSQRRLMLKSVPRRLDRERTTRKQKAHIIWRHKFPNIKIWETLSKRDTTSAVPPSTIGTRAGLLRDNRQNCPRVVQGRPGICPASLRQGSNMPLNNPARVPMVEGGTADAVSLSEGSRWWEMRLWTFKFTSCACTRVSCAHDPVSCAHDRNTRAIHRHTRTNYVLHNRARYTGARARITRTPSAQWLKIDSHAQQKITKKLYPKDLVRLIPAY